MSNLKQLRTRLKSIQSTQKITKAMQMVSASKLKRAKDALACASDLQELSFSAIGKIVRNMHCEGIEDPLVELLSGQGAAVNPENNMLVVFTSDRGLCGSYNSSLLKELKKHMEQFPQTRLVVFGRKGYEYCKKHYRANIVKHFMIASAPAHLSEIAEFLLEELSEGRLGCCRALFGYFKNAISQEVTNKQIIPLSVDEENDSNAHANHELEGESLLITALGLYLQNSMSYFYAQAKASEEGARTTAMDNATRNAGEMMDSLRLKLNRTRQSMITTELIEIISGAEAI